MVGGRERGGKAEGRERGGWYSSVSWTCYVTYLPVVVMAVIGSSWSFISFSGFFTLLPVRWTKYTVQMQPY